MQLLRLPVQERRAGRIEEMLCVRDVCVPDLSAPYEDDRDVSLLRSTAYRTRRHHERFL